MITICFTYFRSLTLANLAAALFSVRQQRFDRVREIVIVDNNTEDSTEAIHQIVNELHFPIPTRVISVKHGDDSRTHSWSTNRAVKEAETPWILFTRADYILDFDLLQRFLEVIATKPGRWNGFISANVFHLGADIGDCETTLWRQRGPFAFRCFSGVENDYTSIDSGVWMMRKEAFDFVGGLDERLTVWGHAQTHFQHKLYRAGVEFVRIPEALFYHPAHGGPRDIRLAHKQLRELTEISIQDMWKRYEGPSPY